ncbi:hypothetical protein CPB83DRAFT_851900 [Crepidotus variabilis]|uniref:Uncharacterized protein n=1 Tax=Crepidotus variabilis TaxID=179855 RepID=A0A9P6EHW2_9AGAR|nr:hypothetical protein CPB83DRAFT_851900 [Crepidotus variabilis]
MFYPSFVSPLNSGTNFTPSILMGFDTCIVIAVMYKIDIGYLSEQESKKRWWIRVRLVFTRKSITKLSVRFLQDNLVYYMMTVLLKALQIVIMYFVGPMLAPATVCLDAVFVCILTCKIFRDLKLGLSGLIPSHKNTLTTGQFSSLQFGPPHVNHRISSSNHHV